MNYGRITEMTKDHESDKTPLYLLDIDAARGALEIALDALKDIAKGYSGDPTDRFHGIQTYSGTDCAEIAKEALDRMP